MIYLRRALMRMGVSLVIIAQVNIGYIDRQTD